MKCQKCDEVSATIHLTEIENDVKKELHLCEGCYKDTQFASSAPPSVDNFVKSFMDELGTETDDSDEKTCPVCEMSYSEFQKKGLLGCSEDYSHFKEEINPLLEKIHGSTEHKGKVPKIMVQEKNISEQLMMLRKELDNMIRNEIYERAAEIRDEIKTLEQAGRKSYNGT